MERDFGTISSRAVASIRGISHQFFVRLKLFWTFRTTNAQNEFIHCVVEFWTPLTSLFIPSRNILGFITTTYCDYIIQWILTAFSHPACSYSDKSWGIVLRTRHERHRLFPHLNRKRLKNVRKFDSDEKNCFHQKNLIYQDFSTLAVGLITLQANKLRSHTDLASWWLVFNLYGLNILFSLYLFFTPWRPVAKNNIYIRSAKSLGNNCIKPLNAWVKIQTCASIRNCLALFFYHKRLALSYVWCYRQVFLLLINAFCAF